MWGMWYVNKLEGIVQCTKRYCKKMKKMFGGAIFEPKTLSMYLKKKKKKKIKKINCQSRD